MNVNVSEILNDFTIRFGVTVDRLIIEMQKYYVVKFGLFAFMFFLLAVISGFSIVLICKKREAMKLLKVYDEDKDDFLLGAIYAFSIVFVIAVVLFGAFLTSCISWIVSPAAGAAEKFLDVIKYK